MYVCMHVCMYICMCMYISVHHIIQPYIHTLPMLKVNCIESPSRNTLLCGSVEIWLDKIKLSILCLCIYRTLKHKLILNVTRSGKTGRNRTFMNPRNTNYKYSIHYMSGMNLAASMQLSMDVQLFRVFQFINYSMDS